MNPEEKISFNQIPHYIPSDYHNKKFGCNELFLCLWLYATANPYGVVVTSLDAIQNDIFPKLKKNTVNKALLSLLKKQYVYFQMRQGRKGSFEIHLNHVRLPKGKGYKTLDKYFKNKIIISVENPQSGSAEVNQKLDGQNQKLTEAKKQLAQHFSLTSERQPIRSHQNETYDEKDIENNDSLDKDPFKGIVVRDFIPTNSEEARCHQIAADIGEPYMDYLLSVRKKHGLSVIEKAWVIFREDRESGKKIMNPPAYFNGIIKKLTSSNQ